MTPERDPRVYFAAERTFLAWIRTGLAMMGFGFVVARFGLFLRELAAVRSDEALAKGSGSLWAGTALVLLGVIVNIHAAWQNARFRRQFNGGQSMPSQSSFGILLAGLLAAIGTAMAAYLVLR